MKLINIILSLFLLSLVIGCSPGSVNQYEVLDLKPEDFSTVIDNKYLTLTPGTLFIYEGRTEEGLEHIEVFVTNEIRQVMGVNTLVVWDREWLNNELIEDTRDWFAQDVYGNVWYFGEDSKEIINGMISSTKGSWEAGVDRAQPGIVMKAYPMVGDIYKQEYYKGEAEDMGEVVALGVQVTGPYGAFTNCVQIKDWTPLESGSEEHKYYCPQVGNVVYEVSLEDGEAVELKDIKYNHNLGVQEQEREQLKTELSQDEAIAIAMELIDGKVTDVEIEKKFGKIAYVIEIDSDRTGQTDVIIEIATGDLLGIET